MTRSTQETQLSTFSPPYLSLAIVSEKAERSLHKPELVCRTLRKRRVVGAPEREQTVLALMRDLNGQARSGLHLRREGGFHLAAADTNAKDQEPIPDAVDFLPIAGAHDPVRLISAAKGVSAFCEHLDDCGLDTVLRGGQRGFGEVRPALGLRG